MLQRSHDLLIAPFGEGSAVYDLVADRVTILDPLATWVLECVPTSFDDLVSDLASVTEMPLGQADTYLAEGIKHLTHEGLLGRTNHRPAPIPVTGQPLQDDRRRLLSATQAVLDDRLAFRSSDLSLLTAITEYLQATPASEHPTVIFDVEPTEGDGVLLHAAEEWNFPTRTGFFVQLPGVINDYAARTHDLLVCHAGAALRSEPDGVHRLVLLPGVPDSGKSTLTAALIALGWDYLGDELIGVRPDTLVAVGFPRALALEASSREVLGLHETEPDNPHVHAGAIRSTVQRVEGDAAPITEVILPTYDPSLDPFEETLAPFEALRALLGSSMNIARCGEDGWRAVCQLAEQVPVTRVVHDSSLGLAQRIANRPLHPTTTSTRPPRPHQPTQPDYEPQ